MRPGRRRQETGGGSRIISSVMSERHDGSEIVLDAFGGGLAGKAGNRLGHWIASIVDRMSHMSQ